MRNLSFSNLLTLTCTVLFALTNSSLMAAQLPNDCGLALRLTEKVDFKRHRQLLGGDIPRRAVEQFSQKKKNVSLKASVEMVSTWLHEYFRHVDRVKEMQRALSVTLERLALLETEWLTYQPRPPYRFKIPNGVSAGDEEVIPIDDPEGTSLYIGSKRDAYKHYRDELATKNQILDLMEKELRAQAVRHHRFEIILRNRGETASVAIPPEIQGLSRRRLELIRDIYEVMSPDQVYAAEMHPSRELKIWVRMLSLKDSARRAFLRKYYLDVPSRTWNSLSERTMAIDEKRRKKLFPILFVSGSIATASLLVTQMNTLHQQTRDLVETIEENTKTPEQLKKELEEKRKLEEEKKLLLEAKDIAEKTNTWKDLRQSFINFSGHFPAEATKIFAEYKLGKRKTLEPDGSADEYYFKVAGIINEWWLRIYEGYSKDGEELIYGAKGRTDIKTEAVELLESFFEQLENPPPSKPESPPAKKPKNPS